MKAQNICFRKLVTTFAMLSMFFSIHTTVIFAQTTELSLQQTIEIASDSSLKAFSAKNLYQASYWEYHAFKAARLPSLNLTTTPLQYYRDITRRYDYENNVDVYRTQQSLYSFGNLSIKQNFDLTGGVFYIDSELGYIRNIGDNTASQFTAVPIRVGYSQNLFGFNSFKWEKRIEPLKHEKAKKKFIYDREDIAVISTENFFELAMAQLEYDMAVANLASSDTLFTMGEQRHEIAAISQSDLLTLKLDVVNARNTLKNSEIALKRANSAFVSFLNFDKNKKVKLLLPSRPKNMQITVEEALSYARENNPDFLGYQQQLIEGEKEVDKTAKSALFDNASFSASIGFNQVAPDFRSVYLRPLQQDIFSLSFSIPLIDWGVRKGKANMAKNNLNVTKIGVEQSRNTLEEDVVMSVNDFNMQQDMIASAEEAMSLATTAYNATRERFIIGKSDISALTLALSRQKEAQKNYITALKNYWVSYYKIRKLTLYDFESGGNIEVELKDMN